MLQGSYYCGQCRTGFVGNQTSGCRNGTGLCPDGKQCDVNAECVKPFGLDRYTCKVSDTSSAGQLSVSHRRHTLLREKCFFGENTLSQRSFQIHGFTFPPIHSPFFTCSFEVSGLKILNNYSFLLSESLLCCLNMCFRALFLCMCHRSHLCLVCN